MPPGVSVEPDESDSISNIITPEQVVSNPIDVSASARGLPAFRRLLVSQAFSALCRPLIFVCSFPSTEVLLCRKTLRLTPTINDAVAVNERSDVWWSAAEPHLCRRG